MNRLRFSHGIAAEWALVRQLGRLRLPVGVGPRTGSSRVCGSWPPALWFARWCVEEVPRRVSINLYARQESHVPRHRDNEVLFGRPDTLELFVLVPGSYNRLRASSLI